MAEHLVRNRQTFFEREERLFARCRPPTTSVSKCRRTPHEVFVPARQRISTGIRRLPCRSSCHHANGMAAVRSRRCRDEHRRLCGAPRMERALFIIFAPQQMIVNRTGLAVLHDLPAGARRARPDRAPPRLDVQRRPPRRAAPSRTRAAGDRRTADRGRRAAAGWPRAAARPPRQPRPHARRACPRSQLLRGARMALDHHARRRPRIASKPSAPVWRRPALPDVRPCSASSNDSRKRRS